MSFLVGAAIIAGTGALVAGGSMLATNKNRKAGEKYAYQLSQEQRIRSNQLKGKLDQTERPQMQAEVRRLQSIYDIASQGITGEERKLAEENISRSSASALRDASSLGGGLRNIGQIQGQAADASQRLSAASASQAQQGMLSAGQMLASAESRQEQYNDLLPYEQMLAEYQATLGASQQNRMLSAQMTSQRATQNAQMGMDIGGSLMGSGSQLAMG